MKINSKKKTVSEKYLQYDALKRIHNSGLKSARLEVPLLGRIVDLVYVKKDCVVTVEFKIHDWRRALKQAKDHLLGADYSYICMPERTVSDELKDELKISGIGLVFHRENGDWPFDIIIDAPKSKETWNVAKLHLIEYLDSKKGNA